MHFLKQEKGYITIIGAFIILKVAMVMLVLIVDISMILLANDQLKTIAESASLQGAGTAVQKAVNIQESPGYYRVHFYADIECLILAENTAQAIITEYKNYHLYGHIAIEDVTFERLENPEYTGYDRFRVAITANITKLFTGAWITPYMTRVVSVTSRAEAR